MLKPAYFPTAAAFREWLEANHARVSELWVGFYRKDTGLGGITYLEAVNEALCFGWIDGIKKRVDDVSYTNRFTPRKPGSGWSAANVRNVERLTAEGRMTAAGLVAYARRDPTVTPYAIADRREELAPALERRFQARPRAWAFFRSQPPGYRRTACHWVMSAKREETRLRRLDTLAAHSAKGERLPMFDAGTRARRTPAERRKAR